MMRLFFLSIHSILFPCFIPSCFLFFLFPAFFAPFLHSYCYFFLVFIGFLVFFIVLPSQYSNFCKQRHSPISMQIAFFLVSNTIKTSLSTHAHTHTISQTKRLAQRNNRKSSHFEVHIWHGSRFCGDRKFVHII